MKPIYEIKLIQIEVTNACHLNCADCTRFIGHHRKSFFMNLDTIVKAIESLRGYSGGIGLMGGEPTLHPRFREICKIYQRMIPDRRKRELWSAGYKWEDYKDIIFETFDEDLIAYNDHSNPESGSHQSLLVAIEEVVTDKDLMWKLIDNCWVQLRWSASITPKGAFFCEVAAAQDHMFDGPGGWPIEKGWWRKTPEEFQDQVERYCPRCSACLPMPKRNNHEPYDLISEGNLRLLKEVGSPRYLKNQYRIANIKEIQDYIKNADGIPGPDRGSLLSHPEWAPWNYRGQVWHGPGEGNLTVQEVLNIQSGKLTIEEASSIMKVKKKNC